MLKLHSKVHQGLKKLDIFLMVIFPLLSVFTSLYWQASFTASIFIFYGPLALWLSIRTPHRILKTLIFSIVLAIPFTIIIDSLAVQSQTWFIPKSVFSSRLFGIVAYEQFMFGLMWTYSIVIFFEHFLDKGKHELIDRRMKYLIWPMIMALMIFIWVILSSPEILNIPYVYLWIGLLLGILPILASLDRFPRLASKYIKVAAYFFYHSMLYELTALQLEQWEFPGNSFVGWVNIGSHRFPLEEFFFWMILGAVTIVAYFEYFDDQPARSD